MLNRVLFAVLMSVLAGGLASCGVKAPSESTRHTSTPSDANNDVTPEEVGREAIASNVERSAGTSGQSYPPNPEQSEIEPKPAAVSLRVVEPPPANHYLSPVLSRQPDTLLRLEMTSERPNAITDDDIWWIENNLDQIDYQVPNPYSSRPLDLPEYVPEEFNGAILVRAIRSNPLIAIYGETFADGRYLIVFNAATDQPQYSLDFSNYQWPSSYSPSERDFVQMSVNWAHVEDEILYVSYGHNTYAASSDGFNAYIAAIDLATSELLWNSASLVCNSSNFIVQDDAIICGYGFTSESDYLYILNKGDGRVADSIPIASAASTLVVKDRTLFVRAYNTDYEFEFR